MSEDEESKVGASNGETDWSTATNGVKVECENKGEASPMEELAQEVGRALEACQWAEVQELLMSVPDGEQLPMMIFSAEQTALHLAVEFNAEPYILEAILRVLDAKAANQPDLFGNTPLHLCCRYATHFEMLQLLVDAYPEAIVQENKKFQTPLDDLFGRDDEDDDEEPWDPEDALTVLLDGYPDAIHHTDKDGQTLLHRSLKYGVTPETIHSLPPLLLLRKPELAHMLDNNQVSPLHEACKLEDSFPVVEDLMERLSTDEWMLQDNMGRTILHYAIYWSASVDIVRMLVNARHELIHIPDTSGKTPMDYLLSFYAPEFSSNNIQIGWNSFLDNVVDMVRAFFVAGPHSDKTRDGELYLHSALYTENCPLPIIEFLVVAAPEQAEEFDDLGNLPLHLAAQVEVLEDEVQSQSYAEVIVELLEHYPEAARTPNPKGKLPLHTMIAKGRTWNCGVDKVLEVHPAAVIDLNLNSLALSTVMSRLDHDTMFRLFKEAPHLIFES